MTADEQQVPSVWARPSRGRREQQSLSQEQIVAEAVRLLDTEGLEALSMRNLGKRLNAGATSLYRHVASKDELLELVADEIYGELDVPPPPTDPGQWREATIAFARSVRAMILRHPWIASVLGAAGMSYLGPNLMRITDQMLGVYEAAGFSLGEGNAVMSTVLAYVTGATISEAAWVTMLARRGQTDQDWFERLWPIAQEAMKPYPRLSRLYADGVDHDPQRTRDEGFDYGLGKVLDGFAATRA
ncbi:TetR/AcrR family transcriptional regulator [Nonomuraea pusilla]|uniref:TetR/AcrR family transcriptional regulator n=1 Tax=Nonomuraea pusilla TaxID=46177 RepID=UPI003319B63F